MADGSKEGVAGLSSQTGHSFNQENSVLLNVHLWEGLLRPVGRGMTPDSCIVFLDDTATCAGLLDKESSELARDILEDAPRNLHQCLSNSLTR